MESIELQTKRRNYSLSNKNKFHLSSKNLEKENRLAYSKTNKENSPLNNYKRKITQLSFNKKNSDFSENNKNFKISSFNINSQNNIYTKNININYNNNDFLQNNKISNSKSINTHFEETSTFLISKNREHESLINLSCEALYYYLKEKEFISYAKIKLLTIMIYLIILATHSMHYTFLLFCRPLYASYYYECFNPLTKSIGLCTSRNVCFCEDMGRCVTLTYDSEVRNNKAFNYTYEFGNLTYQTKRQNYLKFKFGEISNFYIYDYKISKNLNWKTSNQITTAFLSYVNSNSLTVNFNYKKKDNFCDMIFYSFIIQLIYGVGAFFSELIFGYLSDYIGKYIIIKILTIEFIIIQIVYYILFEFIHPLNELSQSYIIWGLFAFFLGTCTTPLKNFATCFFLELYPNKEDLFFANGIIQSATSFSYIINFVFFIKIGQLKFIYLFYFLIASIFFVIFNRQFRENPRFYSEIRYMFDEKLNKELKKLAVMQIIDDNKIQNSNSQPIDSIKTVEKQRTSSNINESLNITKNKEDMIFNKSEIERRIKIIKSEKAILYRKMNFKSESVQISTKNYIRKCPFFFNIFKKKNNHEYSDNILQANTLLNKNPRTNLSNNFIKFENKPSFQSKNNSFKDINKRNSNFNPSNNQLITRRHAKTSSYINSQDLDSLTKDMIKFHYENDLYVKKYIFTYALVKLCFCICYTSQNFYLHNKISNPNSEDEYRSIGFLLPLFLLTQASFILGGKLSFYINSRTINIICLIVFGFILIFVDINLISSSLAKTYLFGDIYNYYKKTTRSWLRLFGIFTISIVNSLFEISIVSYPPTLYRGKVMMKINLISNVVPSITFILVFLIDTWSIYIGTLAIIILFLYFTRLNDYNMEILESRDEAYETLIKTYINKRISKINIVEKLDKRD